MFSDATIIQAHKAALRKGYITRQQYNQLKHKDGRIVNSLSAPIELIEDAGGKAFIHGGAYAMEFKLDDLLS